MIPLAWFSCVQNLTNSVRSNKDRVTLRFATNPLEHSATVSRQVGKIDLVIMFLDYDTR